MYVEKIGRRAVLLFATLVLAGGIGGFAGSAHATSHDLCSLGGEVISAPAVTALRSYRPDLGGPSRLALAPDGALYIADPSRGQIVVRAENGRVLERRRDLGFPVSLAFDGAGNLLIGDGVQGSVTAYDSAWNALYQLGAGAGEFVFPGDIAHDPAGQRTYVADGKAHLIKVYDAAGGALFTFGGRGSEPGQFDFPTALHLDALRGEILVSDQLNFRVQFFDFEGNFICRVGDSAGASSGQTSFIRRRLLSVPQGLWADDQGRIYVADVFEGRVRIIDRSGPGRDGLGDIGAFGEGGGALQGPSDVVIDSHGRLFVAASGGRRLEIYGLDTFSDPETIAPARVRISPNPFDRQAATPHFTALIEIPGYRLDEVDPTAITANGVASEPGSVSVGDRNGDGEPEIEARFPGPALAQTLPQVGEARVVVTGLMASLDFEGYDVVTVSGGAVDADGDGLLDDVDRCLETEPGAVVDGEGCSIAQLCPCDGPDPQTPWPNHGTYVECVDLTANAFAEQGLIGLAEVGVFLRTAARSSCGKGGN